DGLNIYFISRAVHDKGIKVALMGLGSDELFGGYPSFRDVPNVWRIARLVRPFSARLRRGLVGMVTVGRSRAVRSKLEDMLGGNGSLRSLCVQRRRVMSDLQMAQLGLNAASLGLDADYLMPAA